MTITESRASRRTIPRFTTGVSVLMVVIGVVFGVLLSFRPGSLITGLDLQDDTVHRLVLMLGVRSVTMALALLLALVARNPVALLVVLAMRVATDGLDLVVSAAVGSPTSPVTGVVIVLLEVVAIALLLRPRAGAPKAIAG